MRPLRTTRPASRAARTLTTMICVLLLTAAPAVARPAYDTTPSTPESPPTYTVAPGTSTQQTRAATAPAPTIEHHGAGRADALALVLTGVGSAAALLGSGYLGARIATRQTTRPN